MTLTNDSKDFLKAATCAPDNGLAPRIPDGSGERTFTQKFSRMSTITCPAGQTTLIVCTPTIPASCYVVSYVPTNNQMPFTNPAPGVSVGPTLNSIGQEYVETKTEFPEWFDQATPNGINNTSSVAAGRIVSLSAELECTTNAFHQYGTVQAYRSPLQFTPMPNVASGGVIAENVYKISGAGCLINDSVTTGAYMGKVKDGAYSVSMNRNGGAGNFEFTELLDNTFSAESIQATTAATPTASQYIPFKGAPILWDNHFDTIVFKVIVPSADPSATGTGDQDFILKNWVSVEMATVYGSFLNGIAQPSPARDPRAFKLYGAIQQNLPAAVPSKDNPDFWRTVLGLIKPLSGMASLIPGPIGTVARGVHAVSSVLEPEPITGPATSRVKLKTKTHSLQLKRRRRNKNKPKVQPVKGPQPRRLKD